MKRKAGGDGSVTGGTGDYHPQLLQIYGTESATDTATLITIPVPRPNIVTNSSKVVMEILMVKSYKPMYPDVTNNVSYLSMLSGTPNLTAPSAFNYTDANSLALMKMITDPRTISVDCWSGTYAAHSATSDFSYNIEHDDDLQDARGYGFLYPGDNLYWYITSYNTAGKATFGLRIMYRWKKVGITEYLGMVTNLLNN